MRLIRFLDSQGRTRVGRLEQPGTARPLLGSLFESPQWADSLLDVGALLAPIEPPNIIAIGRNYREHAAELGGTPEPEPLVFLKATSSVIGPDAPICLPRSAPDEVDFEAELAVVIGRRARDVSPEDAAHYILGYTCANDVTARDCQRRRDKQWARAKSFDTFCPLGPHIVTADELDPSRLSIHCYLNGRIMQNGNTADMLASVPCLLSYLSRQFTLLEGTVILTGTPPGVGAARTPPVFLRPGDEVRVEVEGIGSLINRVAACSSAG